MHCGWILSFCFGILYFKILSIPENLQYPLNTNALNVILYDQSQREEMHKRLKNEHLKHSNVPGCHVMFDPLVLCQHQIRTLLFSVKPQEYY